MTAQQRSPAFGKDLSIWQGWVTTIGFDLEVALRLDLRDPDQPKVVCDFVGYRDLGHVAEDVVLAGRSLRFRIAWASFQGEVTDEGRLTGTWSQGLRRIAIALDPTDAVVLPKRSQQPKEPLPYAQHAIAYHYLPSEGLSSLRATSSLDADAISLSATLTVPSGAGPHPAVVLISGSGPDTRDAPIMGHRFFAVLSDYLTRQGFAVLRYDERGVGLSTGDFAAATLGDLAMDVRAGVRVLAKRDDIDSERIALIGHSEGGMVAPMVASGLDAKKIRAIVSLAGPATAVEPMLSRQLRALNAANGMLPADVEVLDALLGKQMEILRAEPDPVSCEKQFEAAVRAAWNKLSPDGRGHASDRIENLLASTIRTNTPKFRSWLEHDVAGALRGVDCALLVLIGSKDMQVDAEQNLSAARKVLDGAGHRDVTLRKLSGLNHLFQFCKTGSYREYAAIEETISPQCLQAVRDWLKPRM